MPHSVNHKPETNLLEIQVSGALTREECSDLIGKIVELFEQPQKLRILFDMVDFHGCDSCALGTGVRFAVKHFSDIDRIALVGDKAWEKAISVLWRPITGAQVRYFNRELKWEAHSWLSQRHYLGPVISLAGELKPMGGSMVCHRPVLQHTR